MESNELPPPSAEPSETELLARLRPSGYSELGFLGAIESLDQVLRTDAQTLRVNAAAARFAARNRQGLSRTVGDAGSAGDPYTG